MIPVEREQDELHTRAQALEQVQHALDVALVYAVRRVVSAAGVEDEQALRVLHRIRDVEHVGIDPDAASGITAADEVHVAVPDTRGVDSVPRPQHQFVACKLRRQLRAAGIEQTVFEREAARAERGGAPGGEQQAAFAHHRGHCLRVPNMMKHACVASQNW